MASAEFPVYSFPAAAAPVRSSSPSSWSAWGWGLVWTVALAATLPLMVAYLQYLWRFEHYRYSPILLLFSFGLVYQRWDGRFRAPVGALGWGGIAGSLLLLAAGAALMSPWFGSAGFVLLAAAFLWSHQEADGRRLIYLCFPLLLLVRLPLNYDHGIVVALQGVTTRISSFVLDMIAVPHDVLGMVILLPKRQLLVAEACSGIQSAFTLAFVALACAAWNRRSVLLLPLSIAMAMLWAVLANVLRVSTIASADYALDLDLSGGWQHEVLGYAVLTAAIVLVFSTDRLQACLFHPLSENDPAALGNPLIDLWERVFGPRGTTPAVAVRASVAATAGRTLTRRRSRLALYASRLAWGLVGLVVLLLFAAVGAFPVWLATASASSTASTAAESEPLMFVPPPTIAGGLNGSMAFDYSHQVRGGSDPRLGAHADIWIARHPAFIGELVFSRPYPEWKPLNGCYEALGWQQIDHLHLLPTKTGTGGMPVVACRFHRQQEEHGTLLFAGFLNDGNVQSPEIRFGTRTIDRLRQLLSKSPYPRPLLETRQHAMLQLWITSKQPLPEDVLADALNQFAVVRDRFSEAMAEAKTGGMHHEEHKSENPKPFKSK